MQMAPWIKGLVRGFSRFHMAMLRNLGQVGPLGRSTLILTTKGRKTGRDIATPLLYVEERGKLYVVGSFGGNDQPPGWYLNLLQTPEVSVEIAKQTRHCRSRSLEPAEAQPVWPKLLAIYPSYASYQKKTTRVIPVIELAPL